MTQALGGALAAVASATMASGAYDDAGSAQVQLRLPAISGRVVAVTGVPVAGAIVSVSDRLPRQVTDPQGRFVFADLQPDIPYRLVATKPGYFDSAYGQLAPRWPDTPIVLRPTEWFKDATVTLWRTASIAGLVVNQRGDPVVGALVRSITWRTIAGGTRPIGGPFATTDDRGAFTLDHLLSGSYVVVALRSQPPDARPLTFAPGVPRLEGARRIDLHGGDAVEDANILVAEVPVFTISGRLSGPPEETGGAPIRLVPADLIDLGVGSEAAAVTSAADGSFRLSGVPAGEYVIDVPIAVGEYTFPGDSAEFDYGPRPPALAGLNGDRDAITGDALRPGWTRSVATGRTMWARSAVAIDRSDLSGLVIPLRKAVTLTGRIEVLAGPGTPAPRSLQLESAGGDAHNVLIASSSDRALAPGGFRFDAVQPGRYFVRPVGSSWLVRSVHVAGIDRTATPIRVDDADVGDLRVVLAADGATVQGTVTTTLPARATVVLFPADRDRWADEGVFGRRAAAAHAATNGTFRFPRVPAGDYFIVAVAPERGDRWRDAGFLDAAAGVARRFSIAWGETANLSLTIVGAAK